MLELRDKTLKLAFVTVAGLSTVAWMVFLVQTLVSLGSSLL